MLLTILTIGHVIISLAGIGSGLIVLAGFLANRRLEGWNCFFLITTVATSVTGFFFPVEHFMPSHAVGLISLGVLALAIFARSARHLAGGWAKVYVITAVLALYLNVFVAIVQSFLKIPALHALAPTQTETPFKAAQGTALLLFVLLGVVAAIRFRPVQTPAT